MKKVYIILAGIGCFLPIVIVLLALLSQIPTSFVLVEAYINTSQNILDIYNSILPKDYPVPNNFPLLRALFMAIRFALLIVFIRHLFNIPRMEKSTQLAWLAMLLIFSPATLPIYWVVMVLRNRKEKYGAQSAIKTTI